ncbi:MAG TPA: hypothetical protein VJP88_00295 [Caulobacteraceae bacterium]|nr:hypothetical protein [Caulobacteraceae bacterium]
MHAIKALLTGSDNETLAIGRVLGVALFLFGGLLLPAAIAVLFWLAHVVPKDWIDLLAGLQLYEVAIAGASAGLIAGTAFTEPKPRP